MKSRMALPSVENDSSLRVGESVEAGVCRELDHRSHSARGEIWLGRFCLLYLVDLVFDTVCSPLFADVCGVK